MVKNLKEMPQIGKCVLDKGINSNVVRCDYGFMQVESREFYFLSEVNEFAWYC